MARLGGGATALSLTAGAFIVLAVPVGGLIIFRGRYSRALAARNT